MASHLNKDYANPIKKPPTHPRRRSSPLQFDDGKKHIVRTKPQPIKLPSDDGELLKDVYPFVEEPVPFAFGGAHYGKSLFTELKEEISYERCNYWLDLRLGGPVGRKIYELSDEAERIAAFFDGGLFSD